MTVSPINKTSKPENPGSLSIDATISIRLENMAPLSYKVAARIVNDGVGVIYLTPDIPNLAKASAILQGGSNERVQKLTDGSKLRICRRAVGECHKTEEQDLERIEILGIVATELSPTDTTTVTVKVDTHAPRLHGRWRTIALTTPGYAGAVQTGGILSINEEASPDAFSEVLHGAAVYSELTACADVTTTGTVSGTVTSTYISTGLDTAKGTLKTSPAGGSAAYQCIGASGNVILSGATPGLWIMGNAAGPWAPVSFILDDDTLRLTSKTHQGVAWNMLLSRIAEEP